MELLLSLSLLTPLNCFVDFVGAKQNKNMLSVLD